KYINSNWNEETNPSLYADTVGQPVWNTLLEGRNGQITWSGQCTVSGRTFPITARFNGINNGSLAGSFSYNLGTKPMTLTVTGGRVTYQTREDSGIVEVQKLGYKTTYKGLPITGVRIDFDWRLDGGSVGKGYLDSIDESHLGGIWGTPRFNGGAGGFEGVMTLASDSNPTPKSVLDNLHQQLVRSRGAIPSLGLTK